MKNFAVAGPFASRIFQVGGDSRAWVTSRGAFTTLELWAAGLAGYGSGGGW